MLNGVNIDELNSSQVNGQINGVSGVVTNPISSNPYKNDKNLLIDESAISNEAFHLYQREQDVQKFTSLVTSNPEDLSHEDIIAGLFSKGVSDPLSEESAGALSTNADLLSDLGL